MASPLDELNSTPEQQKPVNSASPLDELNAQPKQVHQPVSPLDELNGDYRPVTQAAASAISTASEGVKQLDQAAQKVPGLGSIYQAGKAPVSTILDYLQKPLNFVSARAITVLDSTVSPGIADRFNKDREWFPETGFHDIINYYTPDNQAVYDYMKKNGYGPITSDAVAAAWTTARIGVGMAADFYGDPLIAGQVKFLTRTQAAEDAYKVGQYIGDKNLVEATIPIAKKQVAIPLESAKQTASKVKNAIVSGIEKIPGGEYATSAGSKAIDVVEGMIQAFNPDTGVFDVDLARTAHSAVQRADVVKDHKFVLAGKSYGFSEGENSLLNHVIENTDNSITREALISEIEKAAPELKIQMAQGRSHDLADAALIIKSENAADLADRTASGLREADQATGLIEGYLAHRVTPEARKYIEKQKLKSRGFLTAKDAEMAGAITESELESVLKNSMASNVSDFDPGRKQRTIRTTVDRANEIMREKTGVSKWFVDDPFIATAIKRSETRKAIRDTQLLESISQYGKPEGELVRKGVKYFDKFGIEYEKVPHQYLEKNGILLPKSISAKISYDILPRSGRLSNINAFLDSYNRVFRTTALLKPDYYFENWIDNILKNVVTGVKMDDYVDSYRVLFGSGSEMVPVGKNGTMTVGTLRKMAEDFNINTGGHFSEGIDKVLYTGKKIMSEYTLSQKVGAGLLKAKNIAAKALSGIHGIGERGENFSRMAMFINRVKQGYSPMMAAREVEKFLFDFKRTTPAMDAVRRFYNPFIQAAMKTAFIAPELIGRSPGKISFYENTVMEVIKDAMRDPVSQFAVQQLYPDYYRLHDRIAGPLLPGNHWLAALAGYGDNKDQQLPLAIALGLPGGMNILNQFLIYDSQVLRNASSGSPVWQSFMIMLTGEDPFTKKSYDISSQTADFAGRLNAATRKFVTGPVAFPNLEKFIQKKYQLGSNESIQYFDPAVVLALHGSLGKFGRVTNLDKEYMFKMMTMVKIEKELKSKLFSAAAKEFNGRTLDMYVGDKPLLKSVTDSLRITGESSRVFNSYVKNIQQIQENQIASEALSATIKPTPDQIAAQLYNVRETIKSLNRAYKTSVEEYIKNKNSEGLNDLMNKVEEESQKYKEQ